MKQIYDNKDIGEAIDKSFNAGIKEGYRRCREQMKKKEMKAKNCKDLEEAAEKWAGLDNCHTEVESLYASLSKTAFIAGAQWQAKQDKETIELAEDHAFLAGSNWQAEQFAKIICANLSEIGKDAQTQFEKLYFEITGTKMYGGYND